MKQIAIISHDKGTAYLQDEINKWFAKAEHDGIEVYKIFIPSGGIIAIIYEIVSPEEIEKIRKKFNIE